MRRLKPANRGFWVAKALLFSIIIGIAGCATERRNAASESSSPIDTLVMLSAPAAVNVEPTPGPDGVAVRIYATCQTRPKALPITAGKLQVLMFDGVISEQTPETIKPLKVWERTPAELNSFANKTVLGISYVLTLLWGEARPQKDNITIVARYLFPDGRTIYSAPSTIPVGDRQNSGKVSD